jgi:Leucine-rich repeat (LRR) protein
MEALAARDSSPDVPWTSGWFLVATPSTPTPADLDRSILLEWRATSPKLQRLWRDANAPLSAWKGVTVGGAKGRVVKLSLSQRKLTSVPASIGNLAALTRLDLSGNQLTSVPAALGRLAALKVLSFRWNKLASVPAELGRLKRLERLKLEFNELTSVPGKLGNLAALKVLDLFSNKLTSVPLQFGVGLYGLNSVDP